MSETPLLPCPFCGESGQRVIQNPAGAECNVVCNCGAWGPQDGIGPDDNEAGPAIAQWNRRAPVLSPEEREALKIADEIIRDEYDGTRRERPLAAAATIRALLARTEAK